MAEESLKSYKIVNTTVKDAYKKNGRDQRTPAEMQGHMVTWPDAKGNPIGVKPGEMKIVAGPLSSDVFRLAARNMVAIEEIADLSTAIKDFEQEARQTNAAAKDRLRDSEKRSGKAGHSLGDSRNAGATPRLESDYPPADENGVPLDSKAQASGMGGSLSAREQKERDQLAKDYTADSESNTVVAKSSNKGAREASASASK